MSYKKRKPGNTTLRVNTAKKGERIEEKVHRIVNNKEPIKDQAPLNYTQRKDGVLPDYNIRQDKWERAIDAMEQVNKSKLSQRGAPIIPIDKPTEKKDGGPEPIQGTETKTT